MAEPTLRNRISGIANMLEADMLKAGTVEVDRNDAKSRALRPVVAFGSHIVQWLGTLQYGTRGRVAWMVTLLSAVVWMSLGTETALAQSPTSFRVYPQLLRDIEAAGVQSADAADAGQDEPLQIIIDTDPGVDDAAALAWLLSQSQYDVEILGIVATAGNASLENATRNVLLLREVAGATHIPVFEGLRRPLTQSLSDTGLLIHGVDGLWSAADVYEGALPRPERLAAWRFYCHVGRELPGATIVTLGPLTNVARALRA
ncbi:MAG: nucleoside hydrolase, partial [Litorilinea sp.]